MAKKATVTATEKKVEKTYSEGQLVKFKGNGKRRDIGTEEYEMNAQTALQLVKRGFGEIID